MKTTVIDHTDSPDPLDGGWPVSFTNVFLTDVSITDVAFTDVSITDVSFTDV